MKETLTERLIKPLGKSLAVGAMALQVLAGGAAYANQNATVFNNNATEVVDVDVGLDTSNTNSTSSDQNTEKDMKTLYLDPSNSGKEQQSAEGDCETYVVKRGDDLFRIAIKAKKVLEEEKPINPFVIAAMSDVDNPNIIFPGKILDLCTENLRTAYAATIGGKKKIRELERMAFASTSAAPKMTQLTQEDVALPPKTPQETTINGPENVVTKVVPEEPLEVIDMSVAEDGAYESQNQIREIVNEPSNLKEEGFKGLKIDVVEGSKYEQEGAKEWNTYVGASKNLILSGTAVDDPFATNVKSYPGSEAMYNGTKISELTPAQIHEAIAGQEGGLVKIINESGGAFWVKEGSLVMKHKDEPDAVSGYDAIDLESEDNYALSFLNSTRDVSLVRPEDKKVGLYVVFPEGVARNSGQTKDYLKYSGLEAQLGDFETGDNVMTLLYANLSEDDPTVVKNIYAAAQVPVGVKKISGKGNRANVMYVGFNGKPNNGDPFHVQFGKAEPGLGFDNKGDPQGSDSQTGTGKPGPAGANEGESQAN